MGVREGKHLVRLAGCTDRGHGAYLLLLLPLLALPQEGTLQPAPHLLTKRVAAADGGGAPVKNQIKTNGDQGEEAFGETCRMDRGHGAYLLLLLPVLALPQGGTLQPVPHVLMKRVAAADGGGLL